MIGHQHLKVGTNTTISRQHRCSRSDFPYRERPHQERPHQDLKRLETVPEVKAETWTS